LVLLRNPLLPIRLYIEEKRDRDARGMNRWHDLVDWVGGWPFEVAKPEEVFRFLRDRGFYLRDLTTSRGHGCNEFVFQKKPPETSGQPHPKPGPTTR
jgi:2-polyprenyl-6-hydroxyphenyl methylase/3-demethylubiquinone-9 3-methyltransferase